MISNFILFNDKIVSSDEPIVKASNRNFKFGDGLFESMRMQNNQLMFAELHAERIQEGAKFLKFEGYKLLDAYFLRQKTAELNKRNKLNGSGRFRLSVFREGEGLYTPDGNKYSYVLESVVAEPGYELNSKGLIVDVYTEITKSINKLSNFKTSNALLFVMAGLFKKQHKLDDAILLNDTGFVCETMSSNIFIVYQGQIYTPSLSEGCISGVMRNTVIKLAKEQNIEIIEAQINPQILNEAEEVFVTNATTGIRWVMGYGRKRYFNKVAKALSLHLNKLIA